MLDDDYPSESAVHPQSSAVPFLPRHSSTPTGTQTRSPWSARAKPVPTGSTAPVGWHAGSSSHGVSIVSGLARGIDTAAHQAALDVGGRTIAVFGTGITMVYPAENADLVARIIDTGGLVVSQFFPTATPSAWTFPRRNEVTSGISQGTVVIEASQKSGARMQARLAYEHGKQVFLVESLATSQEWARTMLEARRAISVRDFDDLARELVDADRLLAASKELHREPFAL